MFVYIMGNVNFLIVSSCCRIYKKTKQRKVFMEQLRQVFSDLTPKAGSDRSQKSTKSVINALELLSISQISTQKYLSGHLDPFLNCKKFSSNRRTSKESFWSIRGSPENVEIIFLLNSKEWKKLHFCPCSSVVLVDYYIYVLVIQIVHV